MTVCVPAEKNSLVNVRHAVYAGSFDPITLGHMAIIRRAAKLFEKVHVAVGHNEKKSGLFSVEKRLELIEDAIKDLDNVESHAFTGLLVEDCRKIGASVIVRGMRMLTDFEHEFQLGQANRDLAPEIETVFLFTSTRYLYISSSLVKGIAANGGDISPYLSPMVTQALREAVGPTDSA